MSLSKDGLICKPNKALLRNALLTEKADVQENSGLVLDGGALLHKVRWSGYTNFGDVCEQYFKYVKKKYTTCIIAFDGYSHVSSTKDQEHIRRRAKQSNTEVHFTESKKCNIKQDVFLANGANKSSFITTLSKNLRRAGNKVVECEEDDLECALEGALELATTGAHVIVVADDTDVALLLLYHWNDTMADIKITSERTKATFSIKSSINSHSTLLKPHLLVLHSWTGCDTRSAIHMKGKTSLLKKIEMSLQVRQMLDTLRDPNADQLEVGVAGIELFLQMYGGKGSLASLRYAILYTY